LIDSNTIFDHFKTKSKMHKTTQTIEWKDMGIQSGGSLVEIKPLFLESNKLIIASGCMIKVYNSQSGELRAEESISNQERFTSMYWESGSKIVYLSTKQGNIYLYNHTTYKVEQCYKLKISINRLLVKDNNIYILNDSGVYCCANITSATTTIEPKKILEIHNGSQFQLSPKGNYLVVCSEFNIHLLNLDNILSSPRPYKSEFLVTSVSFITPLIQKNNTSTITIAFGTTIGRLNYITYTPSNNLIQKESNSNNSNNSNNGNNKQQNQKEALSFSSYFHWHSTPLISMEVSSDGTLLFTGGYENTIVMWSIATNRKKVLPRLGGAIVSISMDPTLKYLAVGLSTNKIQIVQISDQSLVKTILGLQQSASLRNQQPQPITTKSIQIDPKSKNLAISGSMDGFIQFYDLKNNRVDSEIQVSPPKNTLVSTKKTKGVFLATAQDLSKFTVNKTIVEPIEFHKKQPVFVSFESCVDDNPLVEQEKAVKDQILKFWDASNSTYECNFSITCPHTTPITSMSFHPTSSILLTTSELDFKLWKKQNMESVDSITKIQKSYWTCVNQGSYKDMKSTSCSFSSDGSIFAIGFENLVTLWKSTNSTLIEVITYPSDHIVSDVTFVPGTNYLLVNYKDKSAVLWNLETLSPVRKYNFIVSSIAVNDNYYAIAASQEKNQIFNRLLIFNNKDASLVSDVIIPGSNSLVQIMFSKDKDHDCIFGFTSTGLILGYTTCQDQSNKKLLDSTTAEEQEEQQEDGSITSYLGTNSNKKQKKDIKSKSQDTTTQSSSNIYKVTTPSQIFNAASHIIPGVQNVYQKYMDSMLEDSNNTTTTTTNTDTTFENNNNNNVNENNNTSTNNNNTKQQKGTKDKKKQSTFKQQPQTQTQQKEEKFSSMKNFFDTLEEKPVAAPVTATTTTTKSKKK